MTKAQQTYERVEALKTDEGMSQLDAMKQVATETGINEGSVRSAYYTGRKRATGEDTPSRSTHSRKPRETTEQDAIGRAVASLEHSIVAIESEVKVAQERAEEAQREHDAIREAAPVRIEAIRARIAMLQPPVDAATKEPKG